MEKHIKLVIGFIAIISLAAGGYFLTTVKTFTKTNLAFQDTSASSATDPQNDADHDGLTNTEESYWNTDFQNPDSDGDGFKDGEEVASGHDPTVAGPNDILETGNAKNVTQKISSLILSGLYEGSLKSDNQNYDASSQQLADAVVEQANINETLTGQPKALKLLEVSSANQTQYAQKISPVLKSIAANLTQSYLDVLSNLGNSKMDDLITAQEDIIQQDINTLQNLSVPKNWGTPHAELILLLQQIVKDYSLLKNVINDPYQGIAITGKLTNIFYTTLPAILKTYSSIYVK